MRVSKTAIDKAGLMLAKESFQTDDEWLSSEEIFDDFRQKHLQPLTATTIDIQNWLKSILLCRD